MSEHDPKRELADLAARVRGYVERERAAGTGELLARSAMAARAQVRARRTAGAASEAPPPVATGATAAPAASVMDSEPARTAAPAPVAISLFGDDPPDTAAAHVATAPPIVLPPAHAPLNTIEITERAAVQSAALPILEQIASEVRPCRLCGLCETRIRAVPGVGSATSGIVFVGEAPGGDEDRQGEPFVGRAGQLLTQIIKAMDDKQLIPGVTLDRSTVYICNVLKCRPPENRNPLPHEIEACSPYLRRQLRALEPKVICCLGKFAAELLVGVKGTIAALRGKVYRYEGAKLIVTYHPAACLRNPGYKRPVWEDMQLLAREYLAQGVR